MLLLIAGNNLAWAGYYALERAMKPEDAERRRRVAMLGLGGTVLGAIARAGTPPGVEITAPLTGVAICFDEGRPLRRRKVYPAYQTGREGDPKFITNEPTILKAVAEFCNVALMLPVDVLRGKNTEADDLIAGVVHRDGKMQKRIVSTDRDFLQLIDARTSVYSPVKKIIIDDTNFFDSAAAKTSSGVSQIFPREHFLDYRAVIGDPSDNLPGVPGVGPLSAAKLLASAPLDDYFGDAAAVRRALGRKSDAVERAFADGSAELVVARNRFLMNLREPAPCWDHLGELTSRGIYDRAKFEAWLKDQRFSGLDEPALLKALEALAKRP